MGRYEQHRVRTTRCPHCGYLMDAASNADASKAAPVPGDYSVCLNCGEFLRFGSRLRLGRLTRQQLEDVPVDVLIELGRIRATILAMHKTIGPVRDEKGHL